MSQPALATTTLKEVHFLFAQWRETRPHKCPIPEELWTAAVRLSNEYSIHKISRTLRLSHSELKARAERFHSNQAPAPSQDFISIDISSPHPAECIVEMEHRNGNRMRMHFNGKADLDLQSFAESFWSGKV
jgi:hypothetical protein